MKEPVVAVIEYNFEREGEIVVPAGVKAIGQLRQADRSGNVDIRFDRLEMPDGSTQKMDGVAMDLSFRPIKGSVSGTRTGTKFLVRTGISAYASALICDPNCDSRITCSGKSLRDWSRRPDLNW